MLQVHVLAGAFESAHVTALAWVHLLLLDAVQARSVVCDPCNCLVTVHLWARPNPDSHLYLHPGGLLQLSSKAGF